MILHFKQQRIHIFLVVAALIALVVLLTAQAPLPPGKRPPDEQQEQIPYATLEGFARLPADTFAAGPPSGFAIAGTYYGRTPPFGSQPVQGVSAILPKWNGNYLALLDNGYGTKANSGDFILRWYEIALNFPLKEATVVGFTELRDPDHHIPWPIMQPEHRVLTGADFDPESFQQAPDGTFWIGDEFGPYLLHFDGTGKLLEPPIAVPYPQSLTVLARGRPFIQAPENADFFNLPTAEARDNAANLGSSRGLEGLAISLHGDKLYTLFEGAMADDPIQTRLLLQEFSLETKTFTSNYWFYQLSHPEHAIGSLTAIDEQEFLVIERGRGQGEEAAFKRVYHINKEGAFPGAGLSKDLVLDLMSIADVNAYTLPYENTVGMGPKFSFPFISVEAMYPLNDRTLLIVNDNNYPFGSGRRPGTPDNTEFIKVGLSRTLGLRR